MRRRPGDLSRRRQGLHRSGGRPVAVRPHGDHLRRAGIRHQGELEAAGREQRRRLSPRHHALDLAQLHAQLRRQHHAAKGHLLPTKGFGKDLGNGHLTTDNPNYRGRPVAKWISVYGEEAKADIDAIRDELVERLGEARAARVADTNRNLCIFPNLVINDGSSVTVRNFFPVAPGHMKVIAWALGPVEETEAQRARRLHAFLTFYGPGGFATPDDVAALELAQQGFAAWREVPWSDLSRGMGTSQEQLAHRRRPSAGVLAQVERTGGGAAMNAPVAPGAVTRAEVEDFLYHEADLLDRWKLDDWLGLLTEDAAYYVPPNDKPDADHRFTLFTVADDIVRLRERIIRLKDPNCHAEFPPSRTRRMISQRADHRDGGRARSWRRPTSRSSGIAATSRCVSSSAATATSSSAPMTG